MNIVALGVAVQAHRTGGRRRPARRAWLLVLLLASPMLSGCLDPFRAHVDGQALEGSTIPWVVFEGEPERDGWLSARSVETRYTHDPPGRGQPYPGVMQVFSIRTIGSASTTDLLERTREAVDEALRQHGITADASKEKQGERRLENGLPTRWFQLEGHSQTSDGLFEEEAVIRVLGEVGHDGRSNTDVVVVALAQVTRIDRSVILGQFTERVHDERTWIEIAGDPVGSVGGATSQNGFVYKLRTHG